MRLMKHQIDAVQFFVDNKGIAAFHHEVGCGKTISALSCFDYLRNSNPKLKLLNISPISLLEGAWRKELDEKYPWFNWKDLHSGAIKDAKKEPDIYLINFEYLVSRKKFEALCNDLLLKHTWMVSIDEAQKMKNHEGVITERLNGSWDKGKYTPGIRDFCKYRLELTGTPAPNIEWEYWAQMFFLDPDILGDNFYKFRNVYFEMARGKQRTLGKFLNKAALREMMREGWKYEMNPKLRQEFYNRLKKVCHVVKQEDCLDLPDEIDEFRIIEMSDEQKQYYKKMKEEYIIELKHTNSFAVANVALTKLSKLRQITAGFCIDEFDNPVKLFDKNPKMKALEETIDECSAKQMIIWCQFRWEIKEVLNLLGEENCAQLHGGIDQADRIGHINAFIAGDKRFLIAHPQSAAHGLTFVNCHVQVFYSLSFSLENYLQCRGRTHRYGQKQKCVYFHLLAKDTIDQDMLAVLTKKATVNEIADRYLRGT